MTGWFEPEDCSLEEFRAIVEADTDLDDYPHAAEIVEGAVVFQAAQLRGLTASERRAIGTELALALDRGPGIVMLRGAVAEDDVDAASAVFEEIVAEQRAAGDDAGDHFAAAGANDRIWNSLEKLALRAPDVFVRYHANEPIDTVAEAWLGPRYQVTAQVNVVNPGGAAQSPHRDYHLGFMSSADASAYPAHVHRLSPALTLQGAIAHCDMPVVTGPTMYLPHSQKYGPGYLAWRLPEFAAYFETHRCQPELRKGDAVFFNPALFHAAGANVTEDRYRMANLLQIGSAFGRSMERVDRRAMVVSLYPALLGAVEASGGRVEAVTEVIAASAEGYAFPADLDHDQPVDGMAPATMAELVRRALESGDSIEKLESVLEQRFGPVSQ